MSTIDPLREKETMQAYLLGQLTPDAQAKLEERYFRDDESFDLLEEARYELLDDYARGELSAERSRLVEQLLLRGPATEGSLAVARGLAGRAPLATKPARVSILVPIAAAAAVVCLGIAGWLSLQNRQLRSEMAVMSNETAIGTIRLTATVARESVAPPVALVPRAVSAIQVELAVRESDPVVDVTVESATRGRVVQFEKVQRSPSGSVSLVVPASMLPDGDYEFLVTRPGPGGVLLSTFPCRISRR